MVEIPISGTFHENMMKAMRGWNGVCLFLDNMPDLDYGRGNRKAQYAFFADRL